MLFYVKTISITSIYEVHTIVQKIMAFLISSLVAKNISPLQRIFFALSLLHAFIHCTGINIIIKNPHFRCKKLFAMSARFICYESSLSINLHGFSRKIFEINSQQLCVAADITIYYINTSVLSGFLPLRKSMYFHM